MKILSVLFSVGLFASCKPSIQLSKTAYIIGPTNDIKKISSQTPSGIPDAVLNASVLITTRLASGSVKFCTGTLIQEGAVSQAPRILSNHHCFAEVNSNGALRSSLLPESCVNTVVYFGHRSGNVNKFTASCKQGTLKTDMIGDLAAFELREPIPSNFARPVKIKTSAVDPRTDRALIVHYPNQADNYEPLHKGGIHLPAIAVTKDNCSITGLFEKNLWSLDSSAPFALQHTCDLIDGSSGSALLDSKSFELIGVNWGGMTYSSKTGKIITNVATRADYVQSFLSGQAGEYRNQVLAGMPTQSRAATRPQAASGSMPKADRLGCGSIGALASSSAAALWALALMFLTPLALATQAQGASRAAHDPLHEHTYAALTNAIITSEYSESILRGYPNSEAQTNFFKLEKNARPFLMPYAAWKDAELRQQKLPYQTELKKFVNRHVKTLRSNQWLPNTWQAKPLQSWVSSNATSEKATATFLLRLRSHTETPCEILKKLPNMYIKHQSALLSGATVTDTDKLLGFLGDWSAGKRRCLVWTLWRMHQGGQATADPLPLLQVLSQVDPQFKQDLTLMGILALRLLEDQQYAEALRALYDIQEQNPLMRPFYVRTQRAFSFYQKGAGDVMLKSL